MPDLGWVEIVPGDDAGDGPFNLKQCPNCAEGRVKGRVLLLSIEEGRAMLSCPEDGCCGPGIEPEMLMAEGIRVHAEVEVSGGTYEYPNDVNVWFNLEAAP